MPANKLEKLLYWTSTAFVFFLLVWAIIGYHAFHERISAFFTEFGYPTYLIYPLAYLKLAALIVIASNRYNDLKVMAYMAYFVNMCMATAAHLGAGHTPWHAYIGLIVIPISFIYSNKVRGKAERNLFPFWSRRSEQLSS